MFLSHRITSQADVRLQNSRIFIERKQRDKYSNEKQRDKYSNERSGASVETARENGERRGACEARALHTRGSRLRRFAPSENGRKRLFCSLSGCRRKRLLKYNVHIAGKS